MKPISTRKLAAETESPRWEMHGLRLRACAKRCLEPWNSRVSDTFSHRPSGQPVLDFFLAQRVDEEAAGEPTAGLLGAMYDAGLDRQRLLLLRRLDSQEDARLESAGKYETDAQERDVAHLGLNGHAF